MSKKTFADTEVKQLLSNPYVKNASTKGITYTDDFKRIVIAEKENGKFARQIFEECGFDTAIIGMVRIRAASKRWQSAYKKNGVTGLSDTRPGNSGRPRETDLSLEERNTRLEAQLHLLKAENELLKKIHFAERGLKT